MDCVELSGSHTLTLLRFCLLQFTYQMDYRAHENLSIPATKGGISSSIE